MHDIGPALRKRREAAGLTQSDVLYAAKRFLPAPMRISNATLSRIESGANLPDAHLVKFLCRLYGCTVADVSPSTAGDLEKYERALNLDLREQVLNEIGCARRGVEGPSEQLDLFDPRNDCTPYIIDLRSSSDIVHTQALLAS